MSRAWRAALRRWRALALAVAALAALGVRVPQQYTALHEFPARAPSALAHDLADFSNQPNVEWWSVEEDHSNYTTWRYSVVFSCGARCGGHARVEAHDAHAGAAPQHGRRAAEHRVTLERRACTAAPLLPWPWPLYCEELQTEAVVRGAAGGGAALAERWRARCSVLGALSGACARWLRALSDLRLVQLQQHAPQAA